MALRAAVLSVAVAVAIRAQRSAIGVPTLSPEFAKVCGRTKSGLYATYVTTLRMAKPDCLGARGGQHLIVAQTAVLFDQADAHGATASIFAEALREHQRHETCHCFAGQTPRRRSEATPGVLGGLLTSLGHLPAREHVSTVRASTSPPN